jgi:hypothetical protein
LRSLTSTLSFAGKLPQPLPRERPGLPLRVRSRLCEKVQSLASAAVIRGLRYIGERSARRVSDQVLLVWRARADRSNLAQQAKDIFQ